jgi:hypothetical protein
MFRRREPSFIAFDILFVDGEGLRGEPPKKRKALLEKVVRRRDRPQQPAFLLSGVLGAVLVAHANHRGRISASLAFERDVSEERLAVRALPPYQQRPWDIGNASASWAGRPEVRVALFLRFID